MRHIQASSCTHQLCISVCIWNEMTFLSKSGTLSPNVWQPGVPDLSAETFPERCEMKSSVSRVWLKDTLTGRMLQSAAQTELVTFQSGCGLSLAAEFQGTEWTLTALRGHSAGELLTFRFVRNETKGKKKMKSDRGQNSLHVVVFGSTSLFLCLPTCPSVRQHSSPYS